MNFHITKTIRIEMEQITHFNNRGGYESVVSLGYFCSVASEIERMGLRTHSGPFDWQACVDFKKRIELIDTHFKEFFEHLNEEGLYQKVSEPQIYFMKAVGVFLVHDFTMYKSLAEQLPAVREKYERRVASFYRQIAQKTLFIYYVNTDKDVDYINQNIDCIKSILRKFNPHNEIIFVANLDKHLDMTPTYYVVPDTGDVVARKFLNKNEELKLFLENLPFDEEQRRTNMKFHKKKELKKKLRKPYMKLKRYLDNVSKKTYIHTLRINI